jgi:hypothetical protein
VALRLEGACVDLAVVGGPDVSPKSPLEGFGDDRCQMIWPVAASSAFHTPLVVTAPLGSCQRPRELVGAGQKSGQYWALNPDTGAEVRVTEAGPGGTAGGLQWGSAVDGKRVYNVIANYFLPVG